MDDYTRNVWKLIQREKEIDDKINCNEISEWYEQKVVIAYAVAGKIKWTSIKIQIKKS